MSQRILFTHLFAVFIPLCHARLYDLDKIVDNMSNLYLDDSIVSALGDNEDAKYQVTTNIADFWERADVVTTVPIITRKRVPYSKFSRNTQTLGQDLVPARRTDVVIQLQEQRKRNNIHYEFPGEIWPGITFRIPKAIIPFSTPTPTLSNPTRTFKDLFQFYRPKYSANLDFLKRSSDMGHMGLSIPRDYREVYTATLSNPVWNYHFLFHTKPTWFAYKTVTKRVTWPTNTFMRISSNSKSSSSSHSGTITSLPAMESANNEVDYFPNDNYYDKQVTKYYEHYDKLKTQKDQLRQHLRKVDTRTSTRSTRSTRTYPEPGWICYECGRNETAFGSSFCHDVFDADYNKLNARKFSLRYRCNGDRSVSYQCFKRFVDVGWYNERGCRQWPPRRSGTTYASKRLRALEVQLHGVPDGCVFTPQAFLLSYSRTVQLYVRFHVCVCNGTLCNGVGRMDRSWIGLSVLVSAYIVLIM